MGSVLEQVVILRLLARNDFISFLANLDHRIAEAVKLLEGLGFGGLNEHARRDRPRASRRVEAVVLQALGKVGDLQPSCLVKLGKVNEKLVRNTVVLVLVAEGVVGREPSSHVVGIEEGNLGGVGEAFAAKHLDVCPRDEEDGGASEGGGRHSLDSLRFLDRKREVSGKERSEMLSDTDGTDARSSSTVRTAKYRSVRSSGLETVQQNLHGEGLVEIEMANISTARSRVGKTDLSVEVGTVEVDLTAVLVDDLARVLDTTLEHTKGRGVGDHERSKVVFVLLSLGLEVLEIKGAIVVNLDGDDLESSEGGRLTKDVS